MSFDVLFTPIRVGRIELRNRLVMPSMGSQLPGPDGSMSPYVRKYLEERARGGVALILPGHTYVGGGGGKGMANQSRADSDSLVPDMARLTDAVHAHGARIFLQLNHCGRQTGSEVAGEPIVAPSAVPSIGGRCRRS
jgi:2,4-dienoyl-CoA reductase-like NADH-dependent reductase (Old Yellow Enzyme family)